MDNIEVMMGEKISVKLENNLSEIERLSQIVTEFGKRNQLSSRALFDLNLALEEVLTNVISYGYQDNNEHQIIIRICLENGELTAVVEDDGQPFNPLEVPEPDLEKPLEERPVGGLGIYLTRKLMDELEYKQQGGKNILVMKKNAVGG
jgi:anti-sigma regulatory factor (Ser/Thr protein kinase)